MMKRNIALIVIASALWTSAADAAVIVRLDASAGPKADVMQVWENTFGLLPKKSFEAGVEINGEMTPP